MVSTAPLFFFFALHNIFILKHVKGSVFILHWPFCWDFGGLALVIHYVTNVALSSADHCMSMTFFGRWKKVRVVLAHLLTLHSRNDLVSKLLCSFAPHHMANYLRRHHPVNKKKDLWLLGFCSQICPFQALGLQETSTPSLSSVSTYVK